jgi:hypothetical protein
LLKSDIARTRRNHVINLIVIVAVILVVVSIVLRASVARPIRRPWREQLRSGPATLGYRVALPANSGEFAQLADRFKTSRMPGTKPSSQLMVKQLWSTSSVNASQSIWSSPMSGCPVSTATRW